MLNIGEEQIQVTELDAAEKQSASSVGPKRKEFAFAFSNKVGANYQIAQPADSIEYEFCAASLLDLTYYTKEPTSITSVEECSR